MAIRVVQLGSARHPKEGLRIGTVRRPPRGVRKADFAKLNYFDVWLPELAPSAALVKWALAEPWTARHRSVFERRYRSEMSKPEAQRQILLLAALSQQTDFSVGCYCDDETHCHRSILRELLAENGAEIV
jgi:uncharacterized protein YeaO (DUF488 family)